MLELTGTSVTDAGMSELRDLQKLKWIQLGGTEVTDKGLKELRKLKNMRWPPGME
jgi:hypothetical protein